MDEFETVRSLVVNRLSGLASNLTYHCLDHTLDVLKQSERIAADENVKNRRELYLLKVAALYHDTGFLETYAAHEMKSCEIFLSDAEHFDFTTDEKSVITNLIMATQIPQRPETLLERIICDADLDYLGRDDFFSIGDNLRKEFLQYSVVADDEQWEQLQIKFLQNHQYHTDSSRRLREPYKQLNFAAL